MNRRVIFIILGIVILAVSGCVQSTKENASVTPTPQVTSIPATAIPATAIPATPAATALPTLQTTPIPAIKELPPSTLYVRARMLTPSYWSDKNYELETLKIELYNQGNTPLDMKAQILNDGQTLEEKSFSLNGGGSSYQFTNERKHYINSTNVTLRLTAKGYQPVDYPVESVSSMG